MSTSAEGLYGSGASAITALSLRCMACGAPYSGRPAGEILTCAFCGTTARQVDARQFLDHFQAQVTAFLRLAVPNGLDLSVSANADPVARLAAFNSSVGPQLSSESEKYRFALFNLLSQPFVVLPFGGGPRGVIGVDPVAISVFTGKIAAVSSLAADTRSQDLLRRASGIASAYQSLVVAANLSTSTAPERFHLLEQNFRSAATALSDTGRWSSVSTRLTALGAQARAADALLTNPSGDALSESLGRAQVGLKDAAAGLASTPEIGFTHAAVDQEIAATRILASMTRIVQESAAVKPHPLAYIQRLVGQLDQLAATTPGEWAIVFRSLKLREEVLRRAADLRAAQAGSGTVRVLSVGSGVLAPFWIVELPYTFETGSLWTRQGKEAAETLLVAANFPTDRRTLTPEGTRLALTDVFMAPGNSSPPGQIFERVTGKQQKISNGRDLGMIARSVATTGVGGSPAVPALTTGTEAASLVQVYLSWVRAANPKIAAQLRASSPRVTDLVYIPAAPPPAPPLPWLGPLTPWTAGDAQAMQSLAG